MIEELEIVREGRVMQITMNDPGNRNALTQEVCRGLIEAFELAEGDATVGAVLLSAKGNFFSAGMDTEEILSGSARDDAALHQHMFAVAGRLRKPLVAAVQGTAISGGLALVATAHVAIAAQGCSFGLTNIRLGIWPFLSFRPIARALGERRAVELSLTGRIFGTHEALQWGLIHSVAPAVELEDRAGEVAEGLASASPEAIHHGLEFVHRTRAMSWNEAADLAIHFRAAAGTSGDFAEGVRAHEEKRRPRWPSLQDE